VSLCATHLNKVQESRNSWFPRPPSFRMTSPTGLHSFYILPFSPFVVCGRCVPFFPWFLLTLRLCDFGPSDYCRLLFPQFLSPGLFNIPNAERTFVDSAPPVTLCRYLYHYPTIIPPGIRGTVLKRLFKVPFPTVAAMLDFPVYASCHCGPCGLPDQFPPPNTYLFSG